MLVFGDPQPKTAVDVDYYARDIVAPIAAAADGAPAADLGLTLGDVVSDDLSLPGNVYRISVAGVIG